MRQLLILHEAGRKLDGRDVTCYVNPEHISAVRLAVKHSMDDDAGSEIVLVEGTTIRVVETPRQVNEQRMGP